MSYKPVTARQLAHLKTLNKLAEERGYTLHDVCETYKKENRQCAIDSMLAAVQGYVINSHDALVATLENYSAVYVVACISGGYLNLSVGMTPPVGDLYGVVGTVVAGDVSDVKLVMEAHMSGAVPPLYPQPEIRRKVADVLGTDKDVVLDKCIDIAVELYKPKF